MGVLGLTLVSALFAAGLAWHECLLLVTSALAAQRLDLWGMHRAGPLDVWRGSVRCLMAGGVGLLGSAVLGLALLFAAAGWWQPTHDQPLLAIGLIAATGVIITAVQANRDRLREEAVLWLLLVPGFGAGLLAAASGAGAMTCALASIGVAYLAWTSWQLATGGAACMRSDY